MLTAEVDQVPSSSGSEEEDQVDQASYRNRNVSVGVSTDATQTDSDAVDASILVPSHPLSIHHNNNTPSDRLSQPSCSQTETGFLSNLIEMVLPVRRKRASSEPYYPGGDPSKSQNSRTISTQTEEQDPICARGQQLSYLVVQELALRNPIPSHLKDEVYESLASCICDMLVKHSILFHGMVRRCQVTHYHIFACIADEIFEANSNNEASQMRITWGRIISLFCFAVRLAQEYREDPERVDSIVRFLASYVTKHLVPFVRDNGGWASLVEHFPPPVGEDAQMKRAILWSGLCVGLMATMYVSSFLSSR